MKFGFLLLTCSASMLFGATLAQAGDVSCQVDLLKPKMNAAVIIDEHNKPAELTVAEARLRLQKNRDDQEAEETESQQHSDNTAQTNANKSPAKTSKKSSRLGGIFDILLPSKLRNPVK